jgi:hypothetical protein
MRIHRGAGVASRRPSRQPWRRKQKFNRYADDSINPRWCIGREEDEKRMFREEKS